MSEHNCRICGESNYIFELKFEPEDTEAEMEWSTWVCGRCWDIIATIARRMARAEIKKTQDAIDQMWKEKYCNEP